MNKSISLLFFVWMGVGVNVHAQELLTPEMAVEAVLKNGYGIRIAEQQWESLKIDATRGNAGQLPSVGIAAGGNLQSTNINQEFSNGTVIVRNGVGASTTNASLNASWMLFNGMRMFVTYDRLKAAAAGGELLWKLEVDNAIRQALEVYYNLVQLSMEVKSRQSALLLTEEQLLIAQRRFELGSGDKQAVLQSKIARNDIQSAILQQLQQAEILKITLNRLMGRDVNLNFTVPNEVKHNESLSLGQLQSELDKQNIRLALQRNLVSQQQFGVKEAQADRLPTLQLNTAYGLNRNQSEGGFSLYNFSQGPSAGLALNWNVFNGLQVKRNVAQRQIGLQQAQLQQAQVQLEVQSELFTAWRNLESWKQRQVLEDDNLVAAQESFVLAQERFKLGTTSILEVKDAQRSLDEAISRSSAAKVQRKLAEIALLQVSGRLQTR